MSHLFTGVGVAVTTPFKDGEIDAESFRRHLVFLKENNIQSFIVSGTTGEGTTLSSEEKKKLLTIALDVANDELPVIATTGSNDTRKTIKDSKEAEALGADALLVITPYYNKTSQKGLIAHFTAVADAVHTPIILYDVPARTGMTILPETLRIIAKHPNIVGIKDATANLAHVSKCQRLLDKSFAFYSGNDELALPFFSQGGDGLISVIGNVLPAEYQEMYEASQADQERARTLHERLFAMVEALAVDINPIPIKTVTSYLGFGENELRLPLVPLEETEQIPIIETYRKFKEGEHK